MQKQCLGYIAKLKTKQMFEGEVCFFFFLLYIFVIFVSGVGVFDCFYGSKVEHLNTISGLGDWKFDQWKIQKVKCLGFFREGM